MMYVKFKKKGEVEVHSLSLASIKSNVRTSQLIQNFGDKTIR